MSSQFPSSAPPGGGPDGTSRSALDDITVPLATGPVIPGLHGYTGLELIAHGSTAIVFRANQARLNRTVAIKVLLVDNVMTTDSSVARELDTLVRLSSSPHIVSIIDTGVTDAGQPYIVMEYCEGGSYAQILKDRGPLLVEEVLEVGIKIGEALHAAHEVGIIHRDVKPPNVLRSRFGPALTDFGIAYATDEANTETLQKLTPHHASPETLMQQHQTGQSDLYSLASTMWNLLAGRPPYDNPGNDADGFRQRVTTQPVPRVPREDVPEWLQAELARAMSKRPTDRHPTALAFAETLRLHLAQTSVASSWMPISAPPSESDALTVYYSPVGTPGSAPPVISPGSSPTGAIPVISPGTMTPAQMLHPGSAVPSSAAPFPVSGPSGYMGTPPMVLPGGIPADSPSYPAQYPGVALPDAPDSAPRGADDEDDEDDEPPSWRRPLLAAAVLGIILGLAATVGILLVNREPGGEQAGEPTPSASLVGDGAPTRLRLADEGSTVTLRWRDNTDGKAPFVIVGSQGEQSLRNMGQAEKGETTFTLSGLNAGFNYCFRVLAVLSSDKVAASDPVCTKRAGAQTPS